jgi:hypothetical protein
MEYNWLASTVFCVGQVIRPPLNLDNLSDKDLSDICLRMHLILDSIEFTRCEGRLINLDIFDPIDTLYSDLLHKEINRLCDWKNCIIKFGEYYNLDGKRSVEVSSRTVNHYLNMFDQLRIERPNALDER